MAVARYEQFKKQAKNLKRLLPEFILRHTDGVQLADVQELLAKANGYPSFHIAQAALKKKDAEAAAETGDDRGAD